MLLTVMSQNSILPSSKGLGMKYRVLPILPNAQFELILLCGLTLGIQIWK